MMFAIQTRWRLLYHNPWAPFVLFAGCLDDKRTKYLILIVNIFILNSAYKHGITRQSILFCLLNFQNDMVIEDLPLKRLFVGFDHRGIALEIIGLEDFEQERMVVIHAMRLRKQFFHLLPDGGDYEL